LIKNGENEIKGILHCRLEDIFITTKNMLSDGTIDDELRDDILNYIGELYYD